VPASTILARAAWLACLCLWCAFSAAQMPLEKALATGRFPAPHELRLEVAPPLSLPQAIARGKFPAPSDLRLALQPPLSLNQAMANSRFPATVDLTLSIEPPVGTSPAVLAQPLPATTVTPGVAPLGSAAPPLPPSAGAGGLDKPDVQALALVASGSFPVPQPLTVTLVPPETPLAAIAKSNFPAPQPLSVTLVPPATPLAAIASANFPVPQPLSVTLYAGEPLQAAPIVAGIVSGLTLTAPVYTVQIVQAIPRRGVNFFDQRNPAGLATTLLAQAGGAPPVTSGIGIWICDTVVWTDGLGVPYMNSTPPPVPAMRITGGNGVNPTVELLAPWDPVPGTNPTNAGGTFVFPGQIGSAQLAAGCPGPNAGDNRWNQRLRNVEEVTLTPLPHVCVRRNAGDLFPGAGCNAQGN
jgi:hypothetical protein